MSLKGIRDEIKLAAAKNTIFDIVDRIPDGTTNLSLITYQGCRTNTLVNISNTDTSILKEQVYDVAAEGNTPIAASLRAAGAELKNKISKGEIILISDGRETCGGDPCLEAGKLSAYENIELKVFTIGYSVDGETREQLKCIAKQGGGKYFDAKDKFVLKKVLHHIVRENVTKYIDEDGDGVVNEKDQCPNTQLEFKVDEYGCEVQFNFSIYFKTGSSQFSSEFDESIMKLIEYMNEHAVSIQMQGHTDSLGSLASNQRLSERRAKSVMKRLIKLGVTSDRVSSIGFGELKPIADNSNIAGRYKNRRVEARILR
jgi:outer membrane protein OmpA-like peptidoglycan-associated protein